MTRNRFWKILLLAQGALLLSTGARAAMVMEFNQSFGAVQADGDAPWIRATFDDDGDGVRLTILALGSLMDADVTQLYFNFDPLLDPNLLSITLVEETPPDVGVVSILTGTDSYRAGGDGYFDILFAIETGDQSMRLNATEEIVFDITYGGGAIDPSDFFFFSEMLSSGEGNSGPFLAAAHIQSTGIDQMGSDWVAAVPIPAAIWLFASSLCMFGFASRRRGHSAAAA